MFGKTEQNKIMQNAFVSHLFCSIHLCYTLLSAICYS